MSSQQLVGLHKVYDKSTCSDKYRIDTELSPSHDMKISVALFRTGA